MLKSFLLFLPGPANIWLVNVVRYFKSGAFNKMSTEGMFSAVYKDNIWGNEETRDLEFYSGPGSHDKEVVESYVACIEKFSSNFEQKISVVDIGCGDFNIGSKIRPLFGQYTACDVVTELIEYNKIKWDELNVQFVNLDITVSKVPAADVVFVREVFQHLTNSQISDSLKNIISTDTWLIVTESLPGSIESFSHNVDRGSGPFTRSLEKSGVVLTSAPFNLSFKLSLCLNEIETHDGILRTDAYLLE